jgi:hypothetical protein
MEPLADDLEQAVAPHCTVGGPPIIEQVPLLKAA